MIRWICGVKPHDEISIDLLCARLGIQEVTAALRSKRLRLYGHVVRSSSCIKYVTNMEVPCSKAQWRPRKTWSDCVKADMNACSIGGIDPQNRTAWRSGIRSIRRLLPTPATGTNRSSWKIKSGSSQVKCVNKIKKRFRVCVVVFGQLRGFRFGKLVRVVWKAPIYKSCDISLANLKNLFLLNHWPDLNDNFPEIVCRWLLTWLDPYFIFQLLRFVPVAGVGSRRLILLIPDLQAVLFCGSMPPMLQAFMSAFTQSDHVFLCLPRAFEHGTSIFVTVCLFVCAMV